MSKHQYRVSIRWTGNTGEGTASYRGYSRDHVIDGQGKPRIAGSSDPHFRGDAARWNPEELLLAALSACHQLAYLHLCAVNGVVVTAYEDNAEGVMEERGEGGAFTSATLHPKVTIRAGCDAQLAQSLHHQAHVACFIAASVNFPVGCEAETKVDSKTDD